MDRNAHPSRSSTPITPANEPAPAPAEEVVPTPATAPTKSAEEVIEEFRRGKELAREKCTVNLEPAVLNTLRDLKKLHRISHGVAIDIAVQNLYPDLYEKNVQELKDRS